MTQQRELHVVLHVIQGQKIGLRINNANIVCAVHPETAAATAGLLVDDLVVAVDGQECAGSVTAVSLWAKGAGLAERKLSVLRTDSGAGVGVADGGKATDGGKAFPPPPERASPLAQPAAADPPPVAPTSSPPRRLPLSAEEQKALEAAEVFKADGNHALAGNFTTLAKGLYTKAIDGLLPLVATHMDGGDGEQDQLRVALASYYSNRSSVGLRACMLIAGYVAPRHTLRSF